MIVPTEEEVRQRTEKWNEKNPDYDEVLLKFNITTLLKLNLFNITKHHDIIKI